MTARERWVTFDCFGTLVDWHSGFAALLEPLCGPKTADVLRAYHDFERLGEAERPHRSYTDVLAASLRQAAAAVGVALGDCDARTLSGSWGTLPLFPDVERMLSDLRTAGYRLAVLTNCDDDLFAETARAFHRPFDLVVTAEQVRDYKPSLSHFRYFDRTSGVGVGDWVHVACSWHHDIAPAQRLGIRRVWLDREGQHAGAPTDLPPGTVRVESAAGVARALTKLF